MRRASLDPLVVGRVVGDVLDIFVPTAELVVRYATKKININGSKVKPSLAAETPKLRINGSPNHYYTLVSNSYVIIINYYPKFKYLLNAQIRIE